MRAHPADSVLNVIGVQPTGQHDRFTGCGHKPGADRPVMDMTGPAQCFIGGAGFPAIEQEGVDMGLVDRDQFQRALVLDMDDLNKFELGPRCAQSPEFAWIYMANDLEIADTALL